MLDSPISVPSLKSQNEKNHLLIRQRFIDAAEGRLDDVIEEFEKAFDILCKYPQTVTIFGSARLAQDDTVCKQAFAIAWALAKHDYAVVTGGGGGVMEAANHGAMKAGGTSIGFNIHLPTEQKLNPYTTEHFTFQHFFGRKVAMTMDASGYIFCGGGFGTFDEMFEIITLVQTGIIPKVPIILLGTDFWKPLDEFINETLAKKYKTINPIDSKLYTITDDIPYVVEAISIHSQRTAYEEMHEQLEKTKHVYGKENLLDPDEGTLVTQ